MTSRADDPTFAALPRALQRRIDDAFRRAIGKPSPRKRRRLDDDALYEKNASGGFIPDDSIEGGFMPSDSDTLEGGFMLDEPEAGGGFIVDDNDDGGGFIPEPSPPAGPSTSTVPIDHDSEVQREESSPDPDSHIPLSLIPSALQTLDLPPDDEQVMLVFKSAATGWTSGPASARRYARTAGPAEEVVSLRDWRAVCSVLLEPDPQHDGVDDEDDAMDQDRSAQVSDGLVEGSSEEYVESDPGGDSDDQYPDDDNYSDIPAKRSTRSTRRRSTRANNGLDESSEEDVEVKKNRPLTARQKEASRQAFALFLPSSTDTDLEKQRITISDLVRVSKELNEKITYDQMVEMLSLISTSQDKMSVSLADFGRMMVNAKLA
ncbi:hypothetical protein BDM02DRAFT_2904977 [Thelephora ganbajun]|uniref:Uncharacterized protein n=1 Tax=Thelephora ganbajun TaxID=370292 RepID=A0ACB6ZR00_THEGA|nr:hypothetical protein BDM02DRAFT_2904977 [Thelephora ganbajun]